MFFVEGNIGVGKSTLVSALSECGLSTLQEPVDAWMKQRNANDKNILQEFYEDPHRWAYAFQSIAFRSRIIGMKDLQPDCIVERSIYTDRMVFAETARASGHISNVEWLDYTSWFDFVTQLVDADPSGIIYLRACPQTCLDQVRKRAREGEDTITLEYLTALHKRHDAWLMNESNVLVLDVDKDDRSTFVNKVKVFVSSRSP
jgi:deoxyadenosine/deoxycytidine kinase